VPNRVNNLLGPVQIGIAAGHLLHGSRIRRPLRGRAASGGCGWQIMATGRRNDRPELQKALAACRKHKARLVIAKLDRLSRNVAFIATLMDAGVEFLACDNPHATRLTLHILAAVAEHEREMISARTKAALQAAKARGVRLGRNAENLAPANHAAALDHANQIKDVLAELNRLGMTTRQIAAELTARGITSPRGGRWHPQTVRRVMERVAL
jgi:DNA invertase Pin-like site-specific DNA recombinase